LKTNDLKQITVDRVTWEALCDISDELETDLEDDGPEQDHNEITALYELRSIVRRVVAQGRYFDRKDD
jgi:hypothetical protein